MALKFRRGTTAQKSGSLAYGEPYVNTTLGTLQIGGESGDITLLINSASQGISGSSLNITGNAKIDGNLTLGGNITIGDNTSDTVTVTANLSSSLIPSVTNTFDLGSSTKIWRDLYLSTGSIKLVDGSGNIVNTITNENIVTTDSIASGSITLTNSLPAGTVSGSAQVVGILSSLNSYTGSNDNLNTLQTTRIDQLASSTASVSSKISQLETDSGSQNTRITTLESKASTLQTYTASNDTTNTTQNNKLSRLEESTASLNAFSASNGNTSLNSFTSSINTTIKSKLDTDGVISGSSQVTLASTTGFTSYSSSVDSRILTEKGRVDAILLASDADKDSFAEIVSLINSVDTTNDNTFASFYTASVNRLNNLESTSGSSNISILNINSFTSSINTTIKEKLNVETVVSSSAQVVGILAALNTYTASNDTTNNTQNSRLDQLSTASGSAISRLTALEGETLNLELYTGSFATASVTLSNKTISGASNTLSNIGNSSLTNSSITIAGQSTALGGTITAETIRTAIGTVVTGSSQVNFTQLSGISANIISGSTNSTNVNFTISGGSITANLIGGVVSGSSQITAGSTTNFATDVKTQLNSNTVVSGSSQVNFTQLSGISANIISASSDTSNVDMIISGGSISANLYGGVVSGSAQVVGILASLNTYTASNDTTNTTQNSRLDQLSTASGSAIGRLNNLESYSSSLRTAITVAGSDVTVNGNLTVSGTTTTVNSNTVNIGDNVIILNSDETGVPSQNSGIEVQRGTSTNATLVWDEANDYWEAGLSGSEVPLVTTTGTQTLTNKTISGASNTLSNIANASLTNSSVTVGSTTISLGASSTTLAGLSSVTSTGFTGALTGNASTATTLQTARTINGTSFDGSANITIANLVSGSSQIAFSGVTGTVSNAQLANSAITIAGQSTSLGGSVTAETIRTAIGTVVTGSSQIDHNSTTNYSANRHIDHTAVSITAGSGLTGGGDISATRTLSIATGGVTDSMLAGSISNAKLTNSSITIAGQSTALGSSVTAETIRTAIGTVVTGSSQIDLTATTNYASGILTRLNVVGVFSGSSQVSHDSTTGYSANRHIDHTAVSITAGSGLTGGGDISATRTISIANLGVTDAMLAGSISNAKLSNSAITIAGQSTSLGSSVTAETIRTAIGTVVTGSAQIAIASTSGFGTYINQAVLTTSSPTFAGLTINGSITSTGDITAYYTSDKRHKNNIQIIPNALQKVSKLNGVTWEWNDDVNEVTKSTPKTGLIAQEVQEVLPEVVKEREDGFLSLDYSKMTGLLVEAIKEQQSQIHKLTLEIENLKKQKGL